MKRLILLIIAASIVFPLIGARKKAMKQFMNLDGKQPPGYTHIVTSPQGKMIYLSGMGGNAPDGAMPPDFATQAENTFKNIGRALHMAGAEFKDVVKINYFVTDLKNLQELRTIRARYLNMQAPPAATLVQAGLVGDLLVEIECVAIVPE